MLTLLALDPGSALRLSGMTVLCSWRTTHPAVIPHLMRDPAGRSPQVQATGAWVLGSQMLTLSSLDPGSTLRLSGMTPE
ncbi:hypothetical protein [Pseudovibrio sp. SPO723]|uniref:hypothetical protein n=1 Tax=Nesiotobacter zosterae TaxID=392721 RepID=UPI0029C36DCB|nr:hypothetical protein [Pseudovibrio sp. SPO723]MDX5593783.1 hypothetical protein [Pseudovibrio sp. SPO723]